MITSLFSRLGNRLEDFSGTYTEMDCQCALMRNRCINASTIFLFKTVTLFLRMDWKISIGFLNITNQLNKGSIIHSLKQFVSVLLLLLLGSECWQKFSDLSSQDPGVFFLRTQEWGEKPLCTSNGSYRRRQCLSGKCFCVDQ